MNQNSFYFVFTASHTLILLCNIYVSFVFTDPLAAPSRNPGPAGMYVCHVSATGRLCLIVIQQKHQLVDITVRITTAQKLLLANLLPTC